MPSGLLWPFLVVLFEAIVFVIAILLVRMAAGEHDREMEATSSESFVVATPASGETREPVASQEAKPREPVAI
jgi:hypothetical protein